MLVAFIPARGGSKSIPFKNIKEIAGKPLIYWALDAAVSCCDIEKIFVSTDSAQIKKVVEQYGNNRIQVIGRSPETSTDYASSESVMIEFAHKYEFDDIILIQATSPLLDDKDLLKGIELYRDNRYDSVLSVVKQKRFIWKKNGMYVNPENYDYLNRPRRQDFDGFFVENGSFYITSKKLLLSNKSRVSGKIGFIEMNQDTFYEIDEPADWLIIEHLLLEKINKGNDYINKKYSMLITDCDGVLTDGGMYYSENGDELKKFNTRDGMAFELFRDAGYITGIITSEKINLVHRRAEKLKTDEIHLGISDKLKCLQNICSRYEIRLDEVIYIGDDINDLPCIKACGLSACPGDASENVKQNVDIICNHHGGKGVIREIADKLLIKSVKCGNLY